MHWANNILTTDDFYCIKEGEQSTWPYPGRTEEIGITSALQAMYAAVYQPGQHPPLNTNACAWKILIKVQTDRYETASLRVYYTALVCTSLINRCNSIIDQTEPAQARTVPPMLITPFTAEEA